MAFAKISQTACYVPEQIITNDDLSKIMDTSDEFQSDWYQREAHQPQPRH